MSNGRARERTVYEGEDGVHGVSGSWCASGLLGPRALVARSGALPYEAGETRRGTNLSSRAARWQRLERLDLRRLLTEQPRTRSPHPTHPDIQLIPAAALPAAPLGSRPQSPASLSACDPTAPHRRCFADSTPASPCRCTSPGTGSESRQTSGAGCVRSSAATRRRAGWRSPRP